MWMDFLSLINILQAEYVHAQANTGLIFAMKNRFFD